MNFSSFELFVMRVLIEEAATNGRIAERCGVSRQLVKNAMRRIFVKTGMGSRLELLVYVLAHADLLREVENVAQYMPPRKVLEG